MGSRPSWRGAAAARRCGCMAVRPVSVWKEGETPLCQLGRDGEGTSSSRGKSTWEDSATPPVPVGTCTCFQGSKLGRVRRQPCLHVGRSVRCAWVGWCVLSQCCVRVRSLSSVELCDVLGSGRWPVIFIVMPLAFIMVNSSGVRGREGSTRLGWCGGGQCFGRRWPSLRRLLRRRLIYHVDVVVAGR
jgi:hypothetical protein